MRIDIAGAGAAGLSLALRLVRAGIPDLRLTLIDRDFTPVSDRTWCFWDDDSLVLPGIARRQWTTLRIDGPMGPLQAPLRQHTYHMVDSGDFKRLALAELERHDVVFRQSEVHPDELDADLVFQSVTPPVRTGPWLKQHFLGIELRADRPVFDADVATIMDFNVDQSHGFAFMYLLPLSDTHALLEYTLFTDTVLEKETYRQEIMRYAQRLAPGASFESEREEFGVIPMVVGDWNPGVGRIQNIGAAAGLAKASTGYTFSRIQRDSAQIAASLKRGMLHRPNPSTSRKQWMDSLILKILREDPTHAVAIFETLFRANGFDTMLRFLDEKSDLTDDLRLMASVPSWWAFIRRL